MSDDFNVRVGVPQDLDQVMELARMMHEEIGITSFNPDRVLPEVFAALNLDHGVMGVIGHPGGELEGGVLLTLGKLFYSDDDVLEEKGVFIRPDLRAARGGRASRLCEFSKKAADNLGVPLLIGVQNDIRTKGKLKLYERQFGEPIGAFFLYRPGQAAQEAA